MPEPSVPTRSKSQAVISELIAGCNLLQHVPQGAAFIALKMRLRSAVFQHYALYGELELCWISSHLHALDAVYYACVWLHYQPGPDEPDVAFASGMFAEGDST